MASAHDRRSFLRELLRGASRAASGLGELRDAAAGAGGAPLFDDAFGGVADASARPVPAPPTERLATTDDLLALCRELGHEEWGDETAALALTSVRLTPGGSGSSWLGGRPAVPPGFEWPSWEGGELELVAQLALADLHAGGPLPAKGALLVFFAVDGAPEGVRPEDAGACRVLHVGDAALERHDRDARLTELPVQASLELMLPPEPERLALDVWQLDEWTMLRERLAALQGVELEERAAEYHALHRVLGYPDALTDGMQLDAELVSNGLEAGPWGYTDPRADALSEGAAEWLLLLQLSSDDALGLALAPFERLYVWIRERDLRAGRFEGVRAFVR